jgi:hypothetical protein
MHAATLQTAQETLELQIQENTKLSDNHAATLQTAQETLELQIQENTKLSDMHAATLQTAQETLELQLQSALEQNEIHIDSLLKSQNRQETFELQIQENTESLQKNLELQLQSVIEENMKLSDIHTASLKTTQAVQENLEMKLQTALKDGAEIASIHNILKLQHEELQQNYSLYLEANTKSSAVHKDSEIKESMEMLTIITHDDSGPIANHQTPNQNEKMNSDKECIKYLGQYIQNNLYKYMTTSVVSDINIDPIGYFQTFDCQTNFLYIQIQALLGALSDSHALNYKKQQRIEEMSKDIEQYEENKLNFEIEMSTNAAFVVTCATELRKIQKYIQDITILCENTIKVTISIVNKFKQIHEQNIFDTKSWESKITNCEITADLCIDNVKVLAEKYRLETQQWTTGLNKSEVIVEICVANLISYEDAIQLQKKQQKLRLLRHDSLLEQLTNIENTALQCEYVIQNISSNYELLHMPIINVMGNQMVVIEHAISTCESTIYSTMLRQISTQKLADSTIADMKNTNIKQNEKLLVISKTLKNILQQKQNDTYDETVYFDELDGLFIALRDYRMYEIQKLHLKIDEYREHIKVLEIQITATKQKNIDLNTNNIIIIKETDELINDKTNMMRSYETSKLLLQQKQEEYEKMKKSINNLEHEKNSVLMLIATKTQEEQELARVRALMDVIQGEQTNVIDNTLPAVNTRELHDFVVIIETHLTWLEKWTYTKLQSHMLEIRDALFVSTISSV